ncbi:MAG: DUF2344 domain-containing protein [Elusimicrobiales bacterium]|nr:DUF2344 domain-containing protein [Elusimicrobiales bacterium]
MIRYRLKFSKEPEFSKNIGTFDIIKNILIYNFEIYITNKRYKFSYGPALPYGWASDCEYLDVFFTKRENEKFVAEIINKNLPQGIKLVEVKTVPLYFPSVESATDVVEIEVEAEKNFDDLVIDSYFLDIFYDFLIKGNVINMFILYKKTSRYLFKELMDFFCFCVNVKKITRRNIYWFDSFNKLRTF